MSSINIYSVISNISFQKFKKKVLILFQLKQLKIFSLKSPPFKGIKLQMSKKCYIFHCIFLF